MYLMTPDDFEPWVGRMVRVDTLPEPIDMTLTRIQRRPIYPGLEREPFILYFEAPWNVYLVDDAYAFDCGRGGPYWLHISQLQPQDNRRIYQAVFS